MNRTHQININLLERTDRMQLRLKYLGLGIVLTAVVLGWSGYYYGEHSREAARLQAANALLQNQLYDREEEKNRLASIQASEKELLVKRQTVETLARMSVSYTELVNEIDRATPAPITMVGVETVGSRVVLTGFSPDHGQVARLMEGLKNIPRVENVTLFLSALNEKTNEVEYSIEMNWRATNS